MKKFEIKYKPNHSAESIVLTKRVFGESQDEAVEMAIDLYGIAEVLEVNELERS